MKITSLKNNLLWITNKNEQIFFSNSNNSYYQNIEASRAVLMIKITPLA